MLQCCGGKGFDDWLLTVIFDFAGNQSFQEEMGHFYFFSLSL